MKIHLMEQLSDEWFELRRYKMTGSIGPALAKNGESLERHIKKMFEEEPSSFTNEAMQRGIYLEKFARMTYEIETGYTVRQVGFIEMDKYLGCSPDGLVGRNGGVEIKCLYEKGFLEARDEDKINSKFIWQCQLSLLISKRKWWDLVFYHPDFDPNIYIKRIEPDLEMQEKLTLGIAKGKKLMDKYLKNEKN